MSQSRRLTWVLVLNLAMVISLVVVGLVAHSLGVLAAGGDFIADTLAIGLGLWAIHRRDVHGQSSAPTYVALINGLVLLLGAAFVLWRATERLLNGSPEIHGLPVLVVSAISALAMLAGVFILGRDAGKEDLHMRSVLLDTLADASAAAGVAAVGGVIYFIHGLYWLDAAAALAIGVFIGFGAIRLLVDVGYALDEHITYAPPHRD